MEDLEVIRQRQREAWAWQGELAAQISDVGEELDRVRNGGTHAAAALLHLDLASLNADWELSVGKWGLPPNGG